MLYCSCFCCSFGAGGSVMEEPDNKGGSDEEGLFAKEAEEEEDALSVLAAVVLSVGG